MYCLLYLKRSLIRNLQKHISLYLILTAAFLLPLLISIYRDSDAYGKNQYLIAESKGQTFHIMDMQNDDCPYFENIDGLSNPFFEDNTIYLKINDEEAWKNMESLNAYGQIILKRIEAAGKEGTVVRAFNYNYAHGIATDASFVSGQTALLILNIILILFSALIVQSSYRSHLQHFSADMKILSSCGAKKQQINVIFFTELVVVFILSSISSILISTVVLKTLFWFFLNVKDVPGLAWLIYHMDIKNTTMHLVIYFLSLVIVLCCSLKQLHSRPLSMVKSGSSERDRRKKIRVCRSSAVSLARLWRQRTNKVFRSCLWTAIPLFSIFLFLFNYLQLNLTVVGKPSQYEIVVSNYMANFDGFTTADIDYIESMEDVLYVNAGKSISSDTYFLEAADSPMFPVRLLLPEDVGVSVKTQEKFEIAVSKNCAIASFSLGDRITLCKWNDNTGSDNMLEDQGIELIVTEIMDVDTVDWAVDVYVTEELWNQIIQSEPVRQLKIKLKNADNHNLVEQDLRNYFPRAEYTITNHQASVAFIQNASAGVYLLLAYIFGIIFLLVLLILYVRLCDYVRSSMDMAKTLFIIGAEERSLYHSFILQACHAALICAILPVICSLPLSWLVAKSLGENLPLNGGSVLVYSITSVLAAAIFICPISITFRKNIRCFYGGHYERSEG